MTYQQAQHLLSGRASVKLKCNTILRNDGDRISLVLYSTAILTLYPNDTFSPKADGHVTRLTRDRINDYAPFGWRCYIRDGDFYWGRIIEGQFRNLNEPFVDGQTITQHAVLNPFFQKAA